MKIRKAETKDLEQLAKLFDGYRVFYQKDTDIESAKRFLADRMKNQDSVIYVCENEADKLVGFTQLYPLFSSTRMKKLWLLNDLFVDSNFRGKGLSVKLIEKAKELVRSSNACGMFLETGKDNVVGNKLYPRAGFTLNEAANYYEWNNDK